jgi:hypothetical protein
MAIKNFFTNFSRIKYYAILAGLLTGGLLWADYSGTRWLGDDNQSTEAHSARAGHGNFYHK